MLDTQFRIKLLKKAGNVLHNFLRKFYSACENNNTAYNVKLSCPVGSKISLNLGHTIVSSVFHYVFVNVIL